MRHRCGECLRHRSMLRLAFGTAQLHQRGTATVIELRIGHQPHPFA
jgi:hypothetical protein